MLVLSRKKGEAVVISLGDLRVSMTIVEVRGDKVRVGFSAPDDVQVHRSEIQEQIDAGMPRPN